MGCLTYALALMECVYITIPQIVQIHIDIDVWPFSFFNIHGNIIFEFVILLLTRNRMLCKDSLVAQDSYF